jgi:RHH-type proline utilization regulon transcriptional repressor/proline dehydrogenase/delta 1-pyrroline-5-carboxylate dehydrogenase
VQPFGGEGLSGTGPKAGGPLYLLRLLSRRPDGAPRAAIMGEVHAQQARDEVTELTGPLSALRDWASSQGKVELATTCALLHRASPSQLSRQLRGPTGERNVYSTLPRDRVLCLAAEEDDLLAQLAAVCAVGTTAVWPADAHGLLGLLPQAVRARVDLVEDWTNPATAFDAVLHHGGQPGLQAVSTTLAQRPGPIIGVTSLATGDHHIPLERLVIERALSVNTAAAGGNASLMTIG